MLAAPEPVGVLSAIHSYAQPFRASSLLQVELRTNESDGV
jgi:hypothetical protein